MAHPYFDKRELQNGSTCLEVSRVRWLSLLLAERFMPLLMSSLVCPLKVGRSRPAWCARAATFVVQARSESVTLLTGTVDSTLPSFPICLRHFVAPLGPSNSHTSRVSSLAADGPVAYLEGVAGCLFAYSSAGVVSRWEWNV